MPEGPPKKPPRFGGTRIRSFAPKSRGGCTTCKRRRVKCGEERPSCKRCLNGNRQCEGYDEPTKTWTSDTATRIRDHDTTDFGSSSSGDIDSDVENMLDGGELVQGPVKCGSCGEAHRTASCTSTIIPAFAQPSSSPYRHQREQHLFKFFVEIAGASVSRSNISAYYWLGAFPQVAYNNSSVRDCLLAVSAAFQSATGTVFSRSNNTSAAAASFMAYESRAMRALTHGNPSTAEVLNTSMAFWLTAMLLGDWGLSLQHLYHCLSIVTTLEDRSNHDAMQLQYQTALAKIGLSFFRTTRGDCPIHGPGDFLNCQSTCYTPEAFPFATRLADAIHHLQAALPTFELCLELLRSRLEPHSHQTELDTMLGKEIREIRFLINTWSDNKRMQFSQNEWRAAQATTPYTTSPWDQTLSDLIRYVVNDQYSTGIIFRELELRTRVTLPHIVASTSLGNPVLVEDALALMYFGGYTEGLLKTKANFTNRHIRELMEGC